MDWRESERTINAFASKVGRRLAAAGAPSHLIQDVKQELWVAWCKARDSYDETKEASFKTYLWNGMRMHINRWVEENVSKRHGEVVALSLDAEMGEDDGATLQEIIPSDDPLQDEVVLREDTWRRALRLLPPRARQFIQLLRDPPECLLEQVRHVQAKAEYARECGIAMPVVNRVTTSMVFELMDATRVEKTKIAAQIRGVGDKMQRVAR